LDEIYAKIRSARKAYEDTESYAISVEISFYINQLYTGFERIFKNIASFFENEINGEKWHFSLLERMSIEVEGIRPAVISRESFIYLNELRGFRHFFRHAYHADIDQEKLELVLKRTLLLRDIYPLDLQSFYDFLTRIEEQESKHQENT
jgi:hypothetical protein